MSQDLTSLNHDILPPLLWLQGPVQTAQWKTLTASCLRQSHINEDKLLNANVQVINEYNNFDLPKLWGSGKSALADGTGTFTESAQHHIRYGVSIRKLLNPRVGEE